MIGVICAIFLFCTNAALAQDSLASKDVIRPTDFFNAYSTEYAKEIICFLSQKKLNGRETGTKDTKPAADFIIEKFKEMELEVYTQQADSKAIEQVMGAPKKGKKYPASLTNVYARIEGRNPQKYVIVGAHYDHLGNKKGIGIHPGADDNASGIVALLSMAKMFKVSGIVPEYTMLFCAWDGEEKGLLGSRCFVWDWYKKKNSETKHAIDSIYYYMNFDMVGRTKLPESPAVTFAWNNNYPVLLDICIEALKDIPQPFNVITDERTGDGKGGSDYASFSKYNIPFIAWMEDDMHADYHKPTDTPDKIHWEKLRKTTLLAYSVLWRLCYTPEKL